MRTTCNILLIEEDIETANMIMQWLDNNAEVIHITDFNLAKELAHQKSWDLIITDFNTVTKNSLEITEIAKKTDFNTGVIIIAENIKIEFILEAMEHHADALLFKPLQEVEFVSRALALVERAKLKKNKKVILAIGAHPDDVEIGCGGTLAKLHSEGNDINIATLSQGGFGGDSKLRKREAQMAAECLNAKLYLGNFSDTKITHSRDTIAFIENIVHDRQVTHVYTHSIHDSHQDHKNINQTTITACRKVLNIFCYQAPSTTTEFQPNIFIDINDFMDKKLALLSIYESQTNIRSYLEPDLIRATARYWGRFSNYQLVEPMEILKGNF